MKPTYREKKLLDYLFGGFRSTLKVGLGILHGILQISLQNDVRRFGRGLVGLFSQQNLLNMIKR